MVIHNSGFDTDFFVVIHNSGFDTDFFVGPEDRTGLAPADGTGVSQKPKSNRIKSLNVPIMAGI
jgi:hypothetical protein